MEKKVLYRKYRPQDFNTVVGQKHIIKTLINEINTSTTVHAYIFSGPKGSGKTSIAKIVYDAFDDEKNVVIIRQDDYYKDQSHLTMEERVLTNYDHPLAFDNDLLIHDLQQLLNRQTIKKPIYDFVHHTRSETYEIIQPCDVIILEVLFVLEDEKLRNFILCTSNEITNKTPNGIVYDVTSKRLKRIMTGECYDGTKDFDWIKNNKPYGDNLDVYDIETVSNFESAKNKTPFDVIDETLYGVDKFNNIKDKIDWVCNNFEHTQKVIKSDDKWRERVENKEC